MSVTRDIVRSYRAPRAVVRHRLGPFPREDRALAYVMIGCSVIFVAQWPRIAREAHFDPSIPLEGRLAGALMALLFIAPLVLYGIAGLSHLILRLTTGRGSGYGARVALFWALIAASPLWLLNGLVAGFIGPGLELNVVGFLALLAFLVIWFAGLREVYGPVPLEPAEA